MTREDLLLLQSIEECNEIARAAGELAQRLSKALRFGRTEKQDGQDDDNSVRILAEYADLIAVMEMAGFPLSDVTEEAINEKRAKVEKYLQRSQDYGRLDPPECDCNGGEQGDGLVAIPHEPHCARLRQA